MSSLVLEDCWNKIGVNGDQSCPRLLQHIHCRNCEVYAGAAQHSMQRPIDSAYREAWSAQLRQPQALRAAPDRSGLAFRIGGEWLMLPTAMVQSVAPLAPVHTLPHRSGAGLTGIVNVGGVLTPSVALAVLLGVDAAGEQAAAGRHVFARLLVVAWEGQQFALPVADLHGIVRYGAADVREPAATIGKGLQRFLTGVVAQAGLQVGVLDGALVGHQMARLLR